MLCLISSECEYSLLNILYLDFRGYTIRKRFGYELEERFKRILNNYDNIYDGHKALLREGLKYEDAALIVQRWYKKEERAVRRKPMAKDPIHPKLRQADLIQFSQNVITNDNCEILNLFIKECQVYLLV